MNFIEREGVDFIAGLILLTTIFLPLLFLGIKWSLEIECKEGYKKGLGRKHNYEEIGFKGWNRTGNLGFGINIPFRTGIKYKCSKCGKEYIKDYE